LEDDVTAKTITVLGREIKYEIHDVDIHSVEYYKDNPRINYIISKFPPDEVTQDLIEKQLLGLDSTRERIKDLEENKGMIDEVYILRNQVVEGNTRLCAYRRISQKNPTDDRWKKIKARILPDDVTEEELFYILGIFHIKGKKEWDAYEKAAYIHKMIKVLNKSPEDIKKQLGIQTKTLEAMLKAYEVMSEKYLVKNNNDNSSDKKDELKKFSYFNAFYLQKELVQKAETTPAFVDEFVSWVHEDRFKNAQTVRELPTILDNRKACKKFRESEPEEAYEEAKQALYEHKPEVIDPFYKKIREFRDLIREAEINKIKDELNDNKNKKAELRTCYKEFKNFCKDLGLDIN
jgi:hypothetical protein